MDSNTEVDVSDPMIASHLYDPMTEVRPTAVAAFIDRAARHTGIDRAAALALTSRVWQLVAGPLTLLVIASRFSAEMQGYYYTFASLLALQSFVELGLSIVIVNVASHEWSELSLDLSGRPCGAPHAMSRLVSFGRLIFAWYAAASVLFVLIVSVAGYVFFSQSVTQSVSWQAPWFAVVCLAGLQLCALSFTSLLEGCNQVATVQRFRVIQAVGGTMAFWLVAIPGGGLWAAVAMAAVRLATDGYLVAVEYGRFFRVFVRPLQGPAMSWSTDVWPMQWRLGISGVVNYFAFSLFNPVMFRYHGPIVAGQMGMTMQAVGGLQALAIVFISTKVPQFGMLIARRDYKKLDPLWMRSSIVSLVVIAAGACALLGLVYGLHAFHLQVANRLLGTGQTAVLLAAAFLMQISQCETAYMRAHRCEPIVVLSVTTSIGIGLLVWLLGGRFGPSGALGGYLGMMMLIVVWETAIWWRFRAHATTAVSLA